MDREASRGNRQSDKEKGERRRRRGAGEGNVSSPVDPEDGRLAGGGGMLAWAL